jgi:TRAP-type C4-dicarboxylate transport system permease small subunit
MNINEKYKKVRVRRFFWSLLNVVSIIILVLFLFVSVFKINPFFERLVQFTDFTFWFIVFVYMISLVLKFQSQIDAEFKDVKELREVINKNDGVKR